MKNKYIFYLLALTILFPRFLFAQYSTKYVDISTVTSSNISYDVVKMSRAGNHVKAKYFGAKDYDGTTVAERYRRWKVGKKIICYTSAGYMDLSRTPVGLTIDNGKLVNGTLANYDGLVIVYATGGVVVTNLKDADLTVQGCGSNGMKLDLKNNPLHLQMFIEWAACSMATVFQTHLLVHRNQLDNTINNEQTVSKIRERRFLAVGSSGGETVHVIVNNDKLSPVTLFEGARRTLSFLNSFNSMNVTFMINLDPGAQDVFELYNEDGTINDAIKGTVSLSDAANLLVYYYEE